VPSSGSATSRGGASSRYLSSHATARSPMATTRSFLPFPSRIFAMPESRSASWSRSRSNSERATAACWLEKLNGLPSFLRWWNMCRRERSRTGRGTSTGSVSPRSAAQRLNMERYVRCASGRWSPSCLRGWTTRAVTRLPLRLRRSGRSVVSTLRGSCFSPSPDFYLGRSRRRLPHH